MLVYFSSTIDVITNHVTVSVPCTCKVSVSINVKHFCRRGLSEYPRSYHWGHRGPHLPLFLFQKSNGSHCAVAFDVRCSFVRFQRYTTPEMLNSLLNVHLEFRVQCWPKLLTVSSFYTVELIFSTLCICMYNHLSDQVPRTCTHKAKIYT